MAATTVKQSYICPECGGSGRDWREAGITDRYATGEQQWRGYYPTNLCFACDGSGVWGVPKDAKPEEIEAKPEPIPAEKSNTLLRRPIMDDDDWEDPRDRL